jgi:pSer/pThr/pTyr-binding forkhead associated (FHA) protein
LDLESRGRGVSRTFEQPFVVAGRDPRTDLVLDDATVSRRHAYFQAIAGRVCCIDLASRTGLVWEDGGGRSRWLDDTRGVHIGPFRIRSAVGAGPADREDPLTACSLEDAPLPAVFLEFPQRAERPSWRLSGVLTLLGRAPTCRLRLLDPAVSKFHCSLLRTPTGVWVIDLLGRGGIEVSGRRVRWQRLEHGDLLRVGPEVLRFRSEGPARDRSVSAFGAGTVGVAMVPAPRPGWLAPRPAAGDDPRRGPLLPSPAWSAPPAVVAGRPDEPALVQAELMEPLLAQLANQFVQMQEQMCDRFGQMQQQMFDQFQQTMMMMAQVFGTLHSDQMARVREELGWLRLINDELRALQAGQTTSTPAPAPAATQPTVPAPAAPAPGDTSAAEALARIEAVLQAVHGGPAVAPKERASGGGAEPVGPAPDRQEPAPASEPDPALIAPLLAAGAGENGSNKNGAMAAQGPSSEERRAGPAPTPTGDPDAPRSQDQLDGNVHVLLHRRIATLQKERQSRFQRVLELMLGR